MELKVYTLFGAYELSNYEMYRFQHAKSMLRPIGLSSLWGMFEVFAGTLICMSARSRVFLISKSCCSEFAVRMFFFSQSRVLDSSGGPDPRLHCQLSLSGCSHGAYGAELSEHVAQRLWKIFVFHHQMAQFC